MVKKTLYKSVLDQVKLYVAKVKSAKISVEKVIVFGSHAKGTAHKWSDIDVCIVSPRFGRNGFNELVRLAKLKDDTTIDIEAHPMNPQNLTNKYDTLASEIRKYGIDVHI